MNYIEVKISFTECLEALRPFDAHKVAINNPSFFFICKGALVLFI